MKLLIAGDSFAADWQSVNSDFPGWWQLLGNQHSTMNVAQAGCGEYKIYQQLLNQNLDQYDYIIVCHTSPYRIHTCRNPFHTTGLHANSDLILSDIEAKPHSEARQHLLFWFTNIFDIDYAKDIHGMIRQSIRELLKDRPCLHINFFDQDLQLPEDLNLNPIWQAHPGPVNHLNQQGNILAYETVKQRIDL